MIYNILKNVKKWFLRIYHKKTYDENDYIFKKENSMDCTHPQNHYISLTHWKTMKPRCPHCNIDLCLITLVHIYDLGTYDDINGKTVALMNLIKFIFCNDHKSSYVRDVIIYGWNLVFYIYHKIDNKMIYITLTYNNKIYFVNIKLLFPYMVTKDMDSSKRLYRALLTFDNNTKYFINLIVNKA